MSFKICKLAEVRANWEAFSCRKTRASSFDLLYRHSGYPEISSQSGGTMAWKLRREQRSRLVFLEARALHAAPGRIVLHERIPDKSGAIILGHQQRDPCINANHVAVIPFREGIKRVHKPILAPSQRVAIFNR